MTSCAVEAFKDGVSACLHRRLAGRIGQYFTKEEHMPERLRAASHTWSVEGFTRWAAKIGPGTERAVVAICASKKIL
jgi:hypothetical protein